MTSVCIRATVGDISVEYEYYPELDEWLCCEVIGNRLRNGKMVPEDSIPDNVKKAVEVFLEGDV